MRFSERTRRWAIRLAWAGLLVFASLLIGLRVGRPLYYTDGSQPVAATTLIAGGMVRWNSPEVTAELPGPVQGRVAELADGRLIYGRTTADGTTDLVVFDPRRPDVPPEPAYGLNTAHNELAPAVVADGRLYFASDRPEGVGGYDLYVAAATTTGFGAPVPVTICNTALDETDPAPHPDGVELVFVRIDRRVAEGRGGDLWQVRLDAGLDPTPVFAAPARRRTPATADRDPAFAPGGNALWFVHQAASAAPQLQRASRLGSSYDAPQPLGSGWGTRHLRAPLPSADGLHLSLLQPRGAHGDADLWFRSTAEELPPWWPGQRWLEWILLSAAGVCALLLLLLHLGRRWSAMDLVAQCLLLSLLLHVLLYLWLMGVEIASSPLPGDADEGRLEVMVVTSAAPVSASEAPAATDVAARVQFASARQHVAVAAPSAAPAAVARTLAVAETAASWQPEVTRGAVDAETPLQDRALEWGRRSDVAAEATPDAARTPEAVPLAKVAAAAGTAARAADGAAAVTVAPPTASVPNHTAPRALHTAATAVPFAEARPLAPPASTLLDATAAERQVREALESPMAVVAATSTVATAAAPFAPAIERPEAASAAASVSVLSPGAPPAANVTRSPLPAVAAQAMTAPPALSEAEPAAREHAPAARVRDAAPGLATDAPVLAGELPVRAVAPIAIAGPAPRVAAVDAARGEPATPTPPPFELPVTDLARVSGAVRVPTAGSLPHAVATAPPMQRAVVAVRDPAASERTSVPGSLAAVAAVTVARAAEPTATMPLRAAEVGAPERGLTRRAVADPVTPPGSHLARTTAAPDLVRGTVPARPMVQAGATGVAAAPRVLDGSNVKAPVHAGAAAPAAVATSPGRAAGEPMAAPVGGAALAAPARAGAPAPERLAEPPGSLLARFRPERQTAAPRDDTVALPNARREGPRVAVAVADADAARAAARPSLPAPVAAGVPAAAVRIEPQPVSWPTFQRAPHTGAATEPPFAVVLPASLLVRQQGTRALPPQVVSEAPRNAYSNRFGPAKAHALETFGGSEETERAVADGLRYLARIQNADGTWGDRREFDAKYGSVYVGKTALCVLAFLGAGHTPDSNSAHSRVVRLALDHLLSQQDPYTGAFGASSCYGHGIATYALAECYGLTKSPALLRPLEDALVWILQHQGPRADRRNRGGWGYFSPGLAAEDDYARVSVTAWMVMALESARLSGIELPETVLPRAREYLELSFDAKNGWFRYNHKPSRLRSAWPTLPASTPAGAFCLLLLGADVEDEKVQAAVDYTVDRRPEEYRPYDDEQFVLRGQGNVYFWYYGSLCCFLAGGDAWQRWNERLRTVLPAAQSPDGSFAPIDVYAQEAGDTRTDRSYTTAMCVLSLEVYYRYFTPLLLGR